jgi:hypothetical protein
MAVRLNERAFRHAQDLIADGMSVPCERGDWSSHRPSADDENRFIEARGFEEYGRWYLGLDDDASPETKGRYSFPFGDFEAVHRCGVLAAEARSGQRKHLDIERAAAHLHGMTEALRREPAAR